MMIEGSLVYYQSEIEVDSSENFLIALGQKKKALASVDYPDGLAPHHNPKNWVFSNDDDDSYRYSPRHFAFSMR